MGICYSHPFTDKDLIKAVQKGDVLRVQTLLQNDVNVNAKDNAGNTALMLAANNGNRGIVDILLEYKAKVGPENNIGLSALLIAVSRGDKEIVTSILNHAPNLNLDRKYSCNHGKTVLSVAADNGNTEIVDTLLKHEPKPSLGVRDYRGNTALHHAIIWEHPHAVQSLLNHGANLFQLNDQGFTPYDLAKLRNITEINKVLTEYQEKANINLEIANNEIHEKDDSKFKEKRSLERTI